MATDGKCCGNCEFWYDVMTDQEGFQQGECRRRAPLARLLNIKNSSELDEYAEKAAFWPMTQSYDWCGDWELVESSKGV